MHHQFALALDQFTIGHERYNTDMGPSVAAQGVLPRHGPHQGQAQGGPPHAGPGFGGENYRLVLIPTFEVSRMVKRRNRARCSACHRLRVPPDPPELYPWCKVVEAYRPRPARSAHYGYLHRKLVGSRVSTCPNCGHQVDRDIHAARNILTRWPAFPPYPAVNPQTPPELRVPTGTHGTSHGTSHGHPERRVLWLTMVW